MRILVVEDAADIREVFTVLLRAEGAQVVAAANGREATEAATHQHFDVILSDLGLPDVPGDVLIKQLLTSARKGTGIGSEVVCSVSVLIQTLHYRID